MDKIKLGIGSPAYGKTVVSNQNRMWREFGYTLAVSQERFLQTYDNDVDVNPICKSRNEIVDAALKAGCDWVLMVDADTWVLDGRDLLVMISEADRADAAVVVAPVRKRDPNNDHLMVYRRLDQVGLHGEPAGSRYVPIPDVQVVNKVIPVDAAATAVMAINLTWIRHRLSNGTIGRPWFKFEYKPNSCEILRSEDLYFCYKIAEGGGLILCDGRIATDHRGRPPIHEYRPEAHDAL